MREEIKISRRTCESCGKVREYKDDGVTVYGPAKMTFVGWIQIIHSVFVDNIGNTVRGYDFCSSKCAIESLGGKT